MLQSLPKVLNEQRHFLCKLFIMIAKPLKKLQKVNQLKLHQQKGEGVRDFMFM
jgi:hypothetical protein